MSIRAYNYNAPTFELSNDADAITVPRIRLLSVRNMGARGAVSRTTIVLYEENIQSVLDVCTALGNSMGFVRRATSRGDTRVIIRPVIIDEEMGAFTIVGPCYDGDKVTRTQIINDFFNRWCGLQEDAFPPDAIVTLPHERAA